MCLKPGQPGHLPCAKTRKVHVTQKESITIERYVKAINKYKRKWKRNNRGKVWTGEVPRRYCVSVGNGEFLNIGGWVQLQQQKYKEGCLEQGLIERLSPVGILGDPYIPKDV